MAKWKRRRKKRALRAMAVAGSAQGKNLNGTGIITPIAKSVNDKLSASPETWRWIDLTPESEWYRLCNLYHRPGDKRFIYIREGFPLRPVGRPAANPYGLFITVDTHTGKIEAMRMPGYAWAELRKEYGLESIGGLNCVEIRTSIIQARLGE